MLKLFKKIIFFNFVCIFALFALTGCQKSRNSIVNTDDLGKMMGSEYSSDAPANHEMVKLNNGVVIYRDNTNTQAPSGYSAINFSPAKSINFGPKDLNFSPKKVNPR